ncbi:MAG: MBL fold metallo-hydrolase [bacterium]|jgi:glyoxylase-like metal-dependent hydrolase (beta-lactamase superfamily II)
MLEQVGKNIYRSEIPLPRNPLKALNSYIIKGEEKTVIIDTGFNCPESKEAFYGNLAELNVVAGKADVIITHLHADHSGLAHELHEQGARIFMSRGDGVAAQRMRGGGNWSKSGERMRLFGFPAGSDLLRTHPGRIYAPAGEFPFTILTEGDRIAVAGYRFAVVAVPGHTPDMINLFEPEHGFYFSADHVLDPITPNIAFWGFEYPVILKQYFDSLRKIYNYPIKLMFPAHRQLIRDHRKRIDELILHHEQRLREVGTILARNGGEMTVQDVAREMHWKIRARNWEEFPPAQKSFAAGEAMSHLDYLVNQEKAVMREESGVLYFSQNQV